MCSGPSACVRAWQGTGGPLESRPIMSTAQDPPVRNKQKKRRTKQLAAWRLKKAAEVEKAPKKA